MPIWLMITIIVILIIIVYVIITFNSLVKNKTQVEEAFSTMDVYLKKRWDLIPNLVEVVKGYASHESETLNKIVSLRSGNYNGLEMNDKVNTNRDLSNAISKLFAIVENYPDLKANQNFLSLQDNLNNIEEDIAQSRKYYNAIVRDYNIKVISIPSNIIATIFGFKKLSMFEISDEQKENIEINM